MGNHRASPPAPQTNEGKTDQGRGKTGKFSHGMSQRQTGRVGGGVAMGPNELKAGDGNIRKVKDPRLA